MAATKTKQNSEMAAKASAKTVPTPPTKKSGSSAGDRYYYALGRRKTASARVRIKPGSGAVVVNGQAATDYFSGSEPLLHELKQPFVAVGAVNKFDVSAKVIGGGHHGQIGAIRFGIAKALVVFDESNKDSLRRHDLLGRDPRAKERKKFGHRGARKKRQFTKR